MRLVVGDLNGLGGDGAETIGVSGVVRIGPNVAISIIGMLRICLLLGLIAACAGSEDVSEVHAELSRRAMAELDASSLQALAQSPVRALVPPVRLAPKARLMSGPAWFAFTIRDGEVTISLHATHRVHHHLGSERFAEPRHRVRGRPARVTMNEAVQAVTWDNQGTFYALEVECYRTLEDERCKSPQFALDLAEELVVP